MTTGCRTRQWLLAAVVLCASLVPEATAGALTPRQRHEERMARAARLLDAGKWDEALSAYGPWGASMGTKLEKRIKQAREHNDTQKQLELYQAYFHYFPFGALDLGWNPTPWNTTAFAYVELLGKQASAPGDEAARHTLAAAPKYRELTKAVEQRQGLRAAALVAVIVKEHPKSIFCPAAVLRLAGLKRPGDAAAAVCEGHLTLLKSHGATERSQLQTMWGLAAAHPYYVGKPEGHRKAVAAWLAIAQRTDVSYEKCVCLFNAARSALSTREPDGLAQSRRLYRELLAKYPTAFEATEARRGLVQTFLTERKTNEALAAVRELEKQATGDVDLSQPLFDISRLCFAEEKYERALAVLRQVVERYPAGAAAPMAWIGLGETYEKLGREAEMLEAYRTAAGRPSVETQTSIMDASNTRNRAHQWLGAYYTRKENWQEALEWWQAWKPSSWCGTCADSMRTRRAHGIVECLLKLGRKDEALEVLEASVLGPHLSAGKRLAVMLVDMYGERGQLDDLAKKLRKAIKLSVDTGPGARFALDYIALLRMAERGDVNGLWKRLEGNPFSHRDSWGLTAQAARLLVATPDKTVPLAMQKLAGDGDDPLWASALLARTSAPQAVRLIRSKAEAEQDHTRIVAYFYALALRGTDDAYAVLKHHAQQGKGSHKGAAESMLGTFPNPGDAARVLPH